MPHDPRLPRPFEAPLVIRFFSIRSPGEPELILIPMLFGAAAARMLLSRIVALTSERAGRVTRGPTRTGIDSSGAAEAKRLLSVRSGPRGSFVIGPRIATPIERRVPWLPPLTEPPSILQFDTVAEPPSKVTAAVPAFV